MRTRCVEEPFARDTFLAYRRPTGSNPFHPSRGPLAAILPLFPRRLQFPIPVGLNLLLMPGEHVLRRDIADGAVQADVGGAYGRGDERTRGGYDLSANGGRESSHNRLISVTPLSWLNE